MAQTVALDYYAGSVDRMLEGFIKMNQKIQQSGSVEDLRMPGKYGVWFSSKALFPLKRTNTTDLW